MYSYPHFHFLDIGSSTLDAETNVLTVNGKDEPLSDDDSDAGSFDEIGYFGQLGCTARPYPADDSGGAQAIAMSGVGDRDGEIIGMRDTRVASVVGQLKPGDTALYSTGPQHAARLMLKEEKRQSVLMSKQANGKDIIVSLDGNSNKITITGMKQVLELSEDGITLANGGAYIMLKADGTVAINGSKVLIGNRGNTPAALAATGSSVPPIAAAGGAIVTAPADNVFV